jgi:hypothetical protein
VSKLVIVRHAQTVNSIRVAPRRSIRESQVDRP